MDIRAFVDFAGEGARLVLYALIALSVAQLAVIVERALHLVRSRASRAELEGVLAGALGRREYAKAATALSASASPVARIIGQGLDHAGLGPQSADEIMQSRITAERQDMERGLAFLGTLGNNAPFIGLFGTVLGIIRAFADLGAKAGARLRGGDVRDLGGARVDGGRAPRRVARGRRVQRVSAGNPLADR